MYIAYYCDYLACKHCYSTEKGLKRESNFPELTHWWEISNRAECYIVEK